MKVMKKSFRIILGLLFIAIGIAVITFSVVLMLQQFDWFMGAIYISFIAVGLGLVGLGWTIIAGGDVKGAIQDIISGMPF
jgi:hypothetical protein